MMVWTRSIVTAATIVALGAGCVSDGSQSSDTEGSVVVAPDISVTIPPSRLTPFCEAMIDLSDRLRTEEVDDDEALIISTYRSIRADVPAEISADFDAVLTALETGAPAPTDPPLPTTPSSVPTDPATTTVAPTSSSAPGNSTVPAGAPGVDVGYADGNSPSERINNYVTFACRDTQNNPGPQATQPLEGPPPTTAP